jgi:hypothetical protein
MLTNHELVVRTWEASIYPSLCTRGEHVRMGTHTGSQLKFVWKTVDLYGSLVDVGPHPHMLPPCIEPRVKVLPHESR